VSPRGGARPGTGPKPAAGEPARHILRTSVTDAQLAWAEHVAEHEGLTLAEWQRSLVDRAISEHTCAECAEQDGEISGLGQDATPETCDLRPVQRSGDVATPRRRYAMQRMPAVCDAADARAPLDSVLNSCYSSNMPTTNTSIEPLRTVDRTATTWTTHPTCGYDMMSIGRYTVIVWTGSPATDLDDGCEVCEAYIPTTDREFPEGKMLVGHRRLDTRCRSMARAEALDVARDAIADFESRPRRS